MDSSTPVAARVAALIGEGTGEVFDANKGTPMKEWLVVLGGALEFVGQR